jgi:hypothetical protein
MRTQKTIYSVIAIIILAAVGISLLASARWKTSEHQGLHKQILSVDPPGTIHGDKNPELIPDRVAFNLFFRTLSSANGIPGVYNQPFLGKVSKEMGLDSSVTTRLKLIVDEYQAGVHALDARAREIKDQHWPEPSQAAMRELEELQSRKDAIVDGLISSLSVKLGVNEAERVRRYINQSFKTKIKIAPPPTDFPARWAR